MPNGIILDYQIEYTPLVSRSGIDYTVPGTEALDCAGVELHSIPATMDLEPVLQLSAAQLLKATNYNFMITASTHVGRGPSCSMTMWTAQDGKPVIQNCLYTALTS